MLPLIALKKFSATPCRRNVHGHVWVMPKRKKGLQKPTEEKEALEKLPGYKEYVKEHNRKLKELRNDPDEAGIPWYEQ